jgi:hypothetical protein
VKHAHARVLLTKEETVLQGTSDRLIEIGRNCGMEMNVWGGGGAKVVRISRQPSPIQLENVEYFDHVVSMITNDVRCARHIIPGLLWYKEHSTKALLTSKLNLN